MLEIYAKLIRYEMASKQKKVGNELNLDQGSIPKLLLRFSLPAVVGMVISSIYSFVDKIFISHVAGRNAFSGIVVAMPLILVVVGFALLVGNGAATRISIRMGEGRRRVAEKTLGNALVLLILVAAFITTFGLIFLEPLLRLYGARGAALYYATEYLRILVAGSAFQIVGFGLTHMIRAMGKPYQAMAALITGAVLNIGLSVIFVIVLDGGVRGAAISTIIAQSIAMMVSLYILLNKKNKTLRFKFKNFKLDPKIVFPIFSIGISPFLAQIMGSVVVGILNNTLRVQGDLALGYEGGYLALGAMGIVSNFLMLFLTPIFGLNQGSQPILGFNYGAKRYDRVKTTLKYTISIAAAISFIGWCFIMFFPQVPIRMFTDDPELMAIALSGMPIFAGAFLIVGVQLIQAMFFQSIGKARISLMLNMLRHVILFIPLLLILPPRFGLYGIWYVGLTADMVAFLVTTIIFIYTLRTKLRT